VVIQKGLQRTVVTYFKVLFQNSFAMTKETMKASITSAGNWATSEYKSGALLLHHPAQQGYSELLIKGVGLQTFCILTPQNCW
jgi:hypothetical protein